MQVAYLSIPWFHTPTLKTMMGLPWRLRRVKHSEQVYHTCSYKLPIVVCHSIRILSTPNSTMVPDSYFTHPEPTLSNLESATLFTVALDGCTFRCLCETLCWALIWNKSTPLLYKYQVYRRLYKLFLLEDFPLTNVRFHKFDQYWRFPTGLLSSKWQSSGKPWPLGTHKVSS